MLREILESINESKISKEEWTVINFIDKYFDKRWGSPFSYTKKVGEHRVFLLRELIHGVASWRLTLDGPGSNAENDINCVIKTYDLDIVKKYLDDFMKEVKKLGKLNDTDPDAGEKAAIEIIKKLKKKYC